MVEYLNKSSGFNQFAKNYSSRQSGSRRSPGVGFFPRFIIWTALIFLIWTWLMPSDNAQQAAQPTVETDRQLDLSEVPTMRIGSDVMDFQLQGVRISDISLRNFQEEKKSNRSVRLLGGDREFIEIGIFAAGSTAPTAQTRWDGVSFADDSENVNSMLWRGDNADFGRYIAVNDYVITVTDRIANTGNEPLRIVQYARIIRAGGERTQFGIRTGAISFVNDRIKTETWRNLARRAPIFQTMDAAFSGFTDQYWQTIVAQDTSNKTIRIRQRSDEFFQTEISPDWITVAPGETHEFVTNIFAGPKTQTALANAEQIIPGIDRTIDYGWFGILSRPMLWTLEKIHGVIPNWGIAIIFLTLIIRGLMWPLTRKSFLAMQAMQKIHPELKRIQKTYAHDKVRMQQEIMMLYRTKKANPFAGIGLMILQIPIFFALYKALLVAVPLRHAEFLWIRDLSAMDGLLIMPVLMALTMWLQQRFTMSKNIDAPGAQVIKYLPFILAGVFAWMPAGLVLYWTTSNVAGIFQLWIMKKREQK